MLKSGTIWTEEIQRQRGNNKPSQKVKIAPKPTINAPMPLEPSQSKSDRKRIERWRNSDVSSWLAAEKKKEFYGHTDIFEMEL